MPVRVFTIHGVNTDGAWQEIVEGVFSPHFDYVALKYDHYKRWTDLWKILISFGTFGKASAYVHDRYNDFNQKKEFAHQHFLVAHSWGTVISFYMAATWPDVAFDRIILLGAPLNEDYSCGDMFHHQEFAVANEYGGRDFIVQLAAKVAYIKWFGRLKGYLGSAGKNGFTPGDDVHTLQKVLEKCEKCISLNDKKARIHNVPLSEFGHTEVTAAEFSNEVLESDRVSNHARMLWLPFMWRLTPSAYRKFLLLCARACESEAAEDLVNMNHFDEQLKNLEMELISSGEVMSVRQFTCKQLELCIDAHGLDRTHYDIAKHAAKIIHDARHAVAGALKGMSEPSKAGMLDPLKAITRAVGKWREDAQTGGGD